MAINVADNFSYKGGKPLDNRTKYTSVADMVATPAADLYDGCLAYVTATKKNYQYDSTNETDPTLGKWRELQTGGGGGTDYTAGDGIDITGDTISIDPMPAEDMDDVIDELPTGGNIAVTGYVPLGTLIPFYGETAPKFFLACDGSTYNKVDYPELAKHLLSLTNNTPYIVDGDNTKFKVPDLRGEFIRGTGTNSHTNQGSGADVGVHQDGTEFPYVYTYRGTNNYYSVAGRPSDAADTSNIPTKIDKTTETGKVAYINAQAETYAPESSGNTTKFNARPTNTSVLFCIAYKDIYSNPMNDYSTDEKVVGTWIDGKTLYQKTIQTTMADTVNTFKAVDIGADVDFAQMVSGVLINGTTTAHFNGVASDLSGCFICTINTTANKFSLMTSIAGYVSKPCILTFQYTKA